MASKKSKQVGEFGDFQTPRQLATSAMILLAKEGIEPKSILEPTCGKGEFLMAAYKGFPNANYYLGLDINSNHLEALKNKLNELPNSDKFRIINADFFSHKWEDTLSQLDEPLLIVGNPPWVTSTELSRLGSSNLPQKSNFQGRKGIEALTGKSNFDISEWMLLKHLEWLQSKRGFLAMLCKTAVARKVLMQTWKHNQSLGMTKIYKIDALKHFNASVDACLFVVDCTERQPSLKCDIYDSLEATKSSHSIGYYQGKLISDFNLFEKWHHLLDGEQNYVWRSGLKHDCSKVMELEKIETGFRNGKGVSFELEKKFVYPLYKSSDLSKKSLRYRKHVIVTQKKIGEDTSHIANDAPKTWNYLLKYAEQLDRRSSVIYKNKPRFSVFGIGSYTFSLWKLAISGFYKELNFKVLSPLEERPVMVDDTVYFLPCKSQEEAIFLAEILNSKPAKEALGSMIFWSDKRPITIEILKRINIRTLAKELSREEEYNRHVGTQFPTHQVIKQEQLVLNLA